MTDKNESLPQKFHARGIYYGWVILFSGTLGVVMSIPGQTMGISVFTSHLIESLKVPRLELSLAYMLGTLGSALLLPLAGRLLDRLGPRLMATFASLSLGFFLVLIALSPRLTEALTRISGLRPMTGALFLCFLGFLGVRHFGQGQLTMASRTMMGRWFERRRGFVLGISGVFVAFAFGLAPLVLNSLIDAFHWQGALYVLAGLSLITGLFFWIFFRSSPEDFGLLIDGGSKTELDHAHEDREASVEKAFTSSEALRTNAFWAFNMGMVAQALLFTAITFHISDIAALKGLTGQRAFSLFLPVAIISTASDLIGGYFSDRIQMKYLLTAMQSGLFLGLVSLLFIDQDLGYGLTALGLGVSNGLFSLLMGAAWPKLFGRRFLGSISGVSMAFTVTGSALGPYLFSLGKNFFGNYTFAILCTAALPLGVAVASVFVTEPKSC